MTCPNCGAATLLDRDRGVFHCDYCGGEAVPPIGDDGVQLLGETKLACPSCEAMLSDGRIEQRDLLYCEKCRGMFLGMADLMPLVNTLRVWHNRPSFALRRPSDQGERLPRKCPRCSQAMDHHPYGGPGNILIDSCERCAAVWLDQGELQRVVSAPDREQVSPVYSNYGPAGQSGRTDD
jgi:Zn-finger nucleic acid-binding protein